MADLTDDVNSVREDTAPNPITGNVLTNDSDPNGNILVVSNAGTFNLGHGSLVINANGTYTYTLDNSNPAVNALNNGQTLSDVFTYSISDGIGGTGSSTLTVTINGSTDNQAPVVDADVSTIKEDTVPNRITGNVLTNDSDPDGNTLSVTNAGTFNLGHGSLVLHADGSYTYTLDNSNPAVDALNDGQHLTDTFTYNISDGHGGTNSSNLTVTINGSSDNRAPVVDADVNTMKEDTLPNQITGNVLTNDSDPDGNTLSVANAGTVVLSYGTLAIHPDGTYSYTIDNTNPAVNALNNGQHLTDTFTYTASDGHGATSSSTLSITINGTTDNRAPVAEADVNSIKEDTAPNPISGNVLTNDSDPDGNALSVTNAGTFNLGHGVLVINANGTYTYTLDNNNPEVNALNDGHHRTNTFTYNISDGHGGTTSSNLTIIINGTSDNRAPVAVADVNSGQEAEGSVSIIGNLLTNDSDVDGDTVQLVSVEVAQYGILNVNLSDGSYTYTFDSTQLAIRALNNGETLIETIGYSVSDGRGGTATSTLTLTIHGVSANLAPVNSVPATQSALRNNELIFSAATGNSVAISDVDAGAAPMEVTLSANNGTMTLSQTTGLSFTTGDGTADSALTFTGTISDINAALEGLAFSSDTAGAAGISITTSDLGNSGTGGALADTDVIAISVAANGIAGSRKGDTLIGTDLNDDLRGLGGDDLITASEGDDSIDGGAGNDRLRGGGGNDVIIGGRGNDIIGGGRGDDTIDGGEGNDRLRGSFGADVLTGGKGADAFVFRNAEHSGTALHDRITDFSPGQGDRIELNIIDADEGRAGNQAFVFIGAGAFSGKAGELRFEQSGGGTFIYGDTDGDGTEDLIIELDTAIALRARHFDL